MKQITAKQAYEKARLNNNTKVQQELEATLRIIDQSSDMGNFSVKMTKLEPETISILTAKPYFFSIERVWTGTKEEGKNMYVISWEQYGEGDKV